MARGDGKALKGKTRAIKAPVKKVAAKKGKLPVKRMAIGGNPGDMATGGFGTGISGVTGSVDRNKAAGNTGSNFSAGNKPGGNSNGGKGGNRSVSPVAREPGGNITGRRSTSQKVMDNIDLAAQYANQIFSPKKDASPSLAKQINSRLVGDETVGNKRYYDRISPTEKVYAPGSGTSITRSLANAARPMPARPVSNTPASAYSGAYGSPAGKVKSNVSGGSVAGQLARLGDMPARAMTESGVDSGRAQMIADIYNRQAFGPGSPDTFRNGRYDNQKVKDSSSQPGMTRPGFKSGYEDMQSIKPGYMTWRQDQQFTPFAETLTGKQLLERSKKPLTAAEAKKLQKQFPKNSTFYAAKGQPLAEYAYPPPKNLGAYDTYPATIDGYNFNVGIPKGAGVNLPVGPKFGTWNEGAAPGSNKKPKDGKSSVSPAGGSPTSRSRGQNFGATDDPNKVGGRQNDNKGDKVRGKKKKKILLPEEGTEAVMKNGGRVRRVDGAARRGKTRGRYI